MEKYRGGKGDNFSIREKQKVAVVQMLRLNVKEEELESAREDNVIPFAPFSSTWKVLIYDQVGSDIIAPILPVGDLRKEGVTLHKHLDTGRQPVQDLSAVYFVAPTEDNIKRIAKDIAVPLYSSFHFNFYRPLSESNLQLLADSALKADATHLVSTVADQFVDFISLEDRMFTLNQKDSFFSFNKAHISDEEGEELTQKIAHGLFCVCATLSVIPVIQYNKKDTASELVAVALWELLRKQVLSNHSSFGSSNRPLLLICNRSIDIRPLVQHPWTYQAMAHDLLDMRINRVKISVEEKDGAGIVTNTKVYDLDVRHDKFWDEQRFAEFPHMAAAAHEQLEKYKIEKDKVSKISIGIEDGPDREGGASIHGLMASMPELTEKKKMIDQHINIATAILSKIKKRELNVYSSLEEAILTGAADQTKNQVLAILKDPSRGTNLDKFRLMCIYMFAKPNMKPDEVAELEAALPSFSERIAMKAVRELKKAYDSSDISSSTTTQTTSSTSSYSLPSISLTGVSGSSFSGLGSFLSSLQTGVGSVVGSKGKYVTRVAKLMESAMDLQLDKYEYLDPKTQENPNDRAPKKSTPFEDGILFVLGGGNFVEYNNVQQMVNQSASKKRVIYGTTELYSGEEFIHTLAKVAEQ